MPNIHRLPPGWCWDGSDIVHSECLFPSPGKRPGATVQLVVRGRHRRADGRWSIHRAYEITCADCGAVGRAFSHTDQSPR